MVGVKAVNAFLAVYNGAVWLRVGKWSMDDLRRYMAFYGLIMACSEALKTGL